MKKWRLIWSAGSLSNSRDFRSLRLAFWVRAWRDYEGFATQIVRIPHDVGAS